MKTLLKLFVIIAMVLCCSVVVLADDFFVVGAGGPPVGTKITSVPYTISTPGFYFFVNNLTYTGTDNAITINADNVTLDLMGFTLTGPGNYGGIYMNGRTNVEIRNGTVTAFDKGILENSDTGSSHRALDVRVVSNWSGILFKGSNHMITNCNASKHGGTGLFLTSGLISECTSNDNGYGLVVYGPGTVLENSVFNNSGNNFSLGNGVGTAILVNRNSASGKNPNYYVPTGTAGVIYGTNAGLP
jgi:hypothetical protein